MMGRERFIEVMRKGPWEEKPEGFEYVPGLATAKPSVQNYNRFNFTTEEKVWMRDNLSLAGHSRG